MYVDSVFCLLTYFFPLSFLVPFSNSFLERASPCYAYLFLVFFFCLPDTTHSLTPSSIFLGEATLFSFPKPIVKFICSLFLFSAYKTTTILLDGKRVKLQLWDTSGQGRFCTIIRSYSRGAQGILLVYDITNKWSFDGIDRWLKEVEEVIFFSVSMFISCFVQTKLNFLHYMQIVILHLLFDSSMLLVYPKF